MRSLAQGEVCGCELLMNAAPLGLVVGRAGGRASVVLGLLNTGRGGGASRTAREREASAEESSADMASSPAVLERSRM